MSGLLSSIKRLVPEGRFSRGVAVLAGGTALGHGLLVLTSPALTRIYTPEDFGTLAVFAAILGIIVVVASLRYEAAIPLPQNDVCAAGLAALALVAVSLTSLLSWLGVWLLGEHIVRWTGSPHLRPYLWLLPLGVFFTGVCHAFVLWAVRRKTFAYVAATRVTQSFGQVLAHIVLGLCRLGPLGLILGVVSGRAIGSITLGALVWRKDRTRLSEVSLSGMSRAAGRYRRFPLVTTWSALLNSASVALPVLLLSGMFGAQVVGWFALSIRMLQTPLRFVGQAVGQVFFSRASEANRQGELAPLTLRVYGQLVAMAAVPAILLGMAGIEIFTVVFGPTWRNAGVYSQWFAPWLFAVFVASPLSSLVFALERQRGELYFQAGLLAGRVLSLFAGAWLRDGSLAVQLYAVVSGALWFMYLLWLVRISGNRLAVMSTILVRETLVAAVLAAPAAVLKFSGQNELWVVGYCVVALGMALARAFLRLRMVSSGEGPAV